MSEKNKEKIKKNYEKKENNEFSEEKEIGIKDDEFKKQYSEVEFAEEEEVNSEKNEKNKVKITMP